MPAYTHRHAKGAPRLKACPQGKEKKFKIMQHLVKAPLMTSIMIVSKY